MITNSALAGSGVLIVERALAESDRAVVWL
jgi:hypothetical protein